MISKITLFTIEKKGGCKYIYLTVVYIYIIINTKAEQRKDVTQRVIYNF